jgi:hypothetical protein
MTAISTENIHRQIWSGLPFCVSSGYVARVERVMPGLDPGIHAFLLKRCLKRK